MRPLAVLLLALLLAGCDPLGKVPEGEQIDGIWVGPGGACQDGADRGLCEALLTCAVEVEFGGADPGIESWQVHSRPDRLRNGTLLTYGGAIAIAVFDLKDGTRRATYVAETDRCR
jgi:hypothetical protein